MVRRLNRSVVDFGPRHRNRSAASYQYCCTHIRRNSWTCGAIAQNPHTPGHAVIAGKDTIYVTTDDGKHLTKVAAGLTGYLSSLAFTPDGSTVFAGSREAPTRTVRASLGPLWPQPAALGGEDMDEYVQPLCKSCHKLKTRENFGATTPPF
ncbi:hypothetical protein OG819_54395 [Streptomyces sp. NBC_01549]|uniref:hypothetical protein n=1 Tax=unclassified Streptomyces TaxID=2593676 RepID=UPI002258029E|nr:hypothetical protein [Streptomyces sp. NBC_01549]MCX4598160.1 hypothetical protein [Streptomyces sp. NBC_01549]